MNILSEFLNALQISDTKVEETFQNLSGLFINRSVSNLMHPVHLQIQFQSIYLFYYIQPEGILCNVNKYTHNICTCLESKYNLVINWGGTQFDHIKKDFRL